MAENKKQFEIPLYEKPFLSIEEASVYTGIGRDKLYELTNPEDCPFVLWIGNRRMIKRRVFDEYIVGRMQIAKGVMYMPRHSMSFATKRSRLKKIKKTA